MVYWTIKGLGNSCICLPSFTVMCYLGTRPESRYNSIREKWPLAPFFTQIKVSFYCILTWAIPKGDNSGWGVAHDCLVLLEAGNAWLLWEIQALVIPAVQRMSFSLCLPLVRDSWGNATLVILTFKRKKCLHYKAIYSFPMFSQRMQKGMCWKTWLPVDTAE